MLKITTEILAPYCELLTEKNIQGKDYCSYQKWLRYYLDFCHKYQFIHDEKKKRVTHIGSLSSVKRVFPGQKIFFFLA